MDVEEFPKLSLNNRGRIVDIGLCGCYACCESFLGGSITEFTDDGKTALCPRCGVDAVLPGVTDIDDLTRGLERWFTKSDDLTPKTDIKS